MKKVIFLIFMGVVGGWANADTGIPSIKVNCEDVKLSIHSTMEGALSFSAYWNDHATFPEPPKYTEVGDSNKSVIKKFKFECPTLKVSYDGNVAEIKSTSYPDLVDQIPSFYQELDLFSISGYQYPNIKKGFFNSSYKFNLKTFDMKTSIYDLAEGQDLDSDSFKYMSIKKDSIVGYKIDGAELKPLLYDRKISRYKNDLNSAKTIDIFHKISNSNVGVVVQRIYIDKENGILRIYKKSPFPQK